MSTADEQYEPLHRQVDLDGVMIDEKIAPLIKALWDNGFDTYMSCQGGPVQVSILYHPDSWVIFSDYLDADSFMRQTISMLTRRVPRYHWYTPEERGRDGLWVLNNTNLKLEPMDPYETSTIRGKVSFNSAVLQEITKLWVVESGDSTDG